MVDLFDFAVKGMRAQAEINRLCHANDPETSHKAAEKIVKSGKLERQERLVLITIEDICKTLAKDNFTPKEIAKWNDRFSYSTIQRRLSGLHRKGKIERLSEDGTVWFEDCGKKKMVRKGCCVWALIKER